MPKSSTPRELVAAASDAFSADGTKMRAMLREVRQKAQEHTRERARNRLGAALAGKTPESRPPRSAAAPQAIPRLEPDWPLEIRLRNGRKVRAVFTPAVARRRDLTTLGRVSAANDRQALALIKQQGDALESLKRSHEELARKVAALQEQADRALVTLLQGLAGVNEQLQSVTVQEQASRAEHLAVRKLTTRHQRELQSLATTSRIQQVTAVVNSVQAAAYSQRQGVLAPNNLLLAANQLFWIFLDPLLRRLGIIGGASPSLATWLAPLGSLVTGYLALGNRQHVRFLSGIVTLDDTTTVVRESLRSRIADDLWPEFQRRTDVPATAVLLDPLTGAQAQAIATVEAGVLRIELSGYISAIKFQVRVAWMVDVGADVG